MCSNSINKALKSLDFVENVDANVKTYTFEIYFKPNIAIDFDLIRKKVENAGFSVCSFEADIMFENVPVPATLSLEVGEKTFLFDNAKYKILDGLKRIKVLDKGFVFPRELGNNMRPALKPKTYNVKIS